MSTTIISDGSIRPHLRQFLSHQRFCIRDKLMIISFRLKPSGIISISWLKTTMADMIFKDQHVDVKKLQKKDKHRSGERVRALTWSHMIARKKYGTNNFSILKKIAFRITTHRRQNKHKLVMTFKSTSHL